MMSIVIWRKIVVVMTRRGLVVLVAGFGMRAVTVLLNSEDRRVAAVALKAARGLEGMHPSHRAEGDEADGDASEMRELHERLPVNATDELASSLGIK